MINNKVTKCGKCKYIIIEGDRTYLFELNNRRLSFKNLSAMAKGELGRILIIDALNDSLKYSISSVISDYISTSNELYFIPQGNYIDFNFDEQNNFIEACFDLVCQSDSKYHKVVDTKITLINQNLKNN